MQLSQSDDQKEEIAVAYGESFSAPETNFQFTNGIRPTVRGGGEALTIVTYAGQISFADRRNQQNMHPREIQTRMRGAFEMILT